MTYRDLFTTWSGIALNALVLVLDLFLDLALGFRLQSGTRREREEAAAAGYDKSAHLVTVLHGGNYAPYIWHTLWSYFFVHTSYVHPEFVLRKNACLWFLEGDTAVFAVCDEKEDFYNTEKIPFLFFSLESLARKLVVMPMSSFHALADKVGDPKAKLMLVNMTARCGSTLVAQVMSELPNSRSLSEPQAFNDVCAQFRSGQVGQTEFTKRIRSLVRIYCKTAEGEKLDSVSMKLSPFTASAVRTMKALFPESKLVFNTRHPKPSMLSLMKVIEGGTLENIVSKLGFYQRFWYATFPFTLPTPLPCEANIRARLRPYYDGSREGKLQNYTLIYALPWVQYLRDRDIYDHVLLYEDLSAESERETRRLLQVLDLPDGHLEQAMRAFARDSQKGTLAPRGNFAGEGAVTGQHWAIINGVMAELGLPISCESELEEYRAAAKEGELNHQ